MYISNRNFIKDAHYINIYYILQKIREENEYRRYDILDEYPFILNLLYSILNTFNNIDIYSYIPINTNKYAYRITIVDTNVTISIFFSRNGIVTVQIQAHNYYYNEYMKTINIFKETINISNWKLIPGISSTLSNDVKYESISGASPNKL